VTLFDSHLDLPVEALFFWLHTPPVFAAELEGTAKVPEVACIPTYWLASGAVAILILGCVVGAVAGRNLVKASAAHGAALAVAKLRVQEQVETNKAVALGGADVSR
jgi:hypothetical protein